jgi:hypothetical protein
MAQVARIPRLGVERDFKTQWVQTSGFGHTRSMTELLWRWALEEIMKPLEFLRSTIPHGLGFPDTGYPIFHGMVRKVDPFARRPSWP